MYLARTKSSIVNKYDSDMVMLDKVISGQF